MLLERVCNWTNINIWWHLRIKADCDSDLSDLQSVLCIKNRFHIFLFTHVMLPLVFLCAISIIIITLHLCSLEAHALLPVLCGDC